MPRKVPPFSRRNRRKKVNRLDSIMRDYQPLLGRWLLELALQFQWYRSKDNDRLACPDLFDDEDFLLLTGLPRLDEDVEDLPARGQWKTLLEDQLAVLDKKYEAMPRNHALFTNIGLLADLLGLNEAEQEVLLFTAALDLFATFKGAIVSRRERASNQVLCEALAAATGLPEKDFRAALDQDGLLRSTGLIRLESTLMDIEEKLDLISGLSGVLLTPHATAEELLRQFVRPASPPTLDLTDFPHMQRDLGAILPYLTEVVADRSVGSNILFYGPPGVGKTELAQALAAKLEIQLYEISFSDEDGDPIKGEARLRAYNLCQKLLAQKANALLMFDEVEDVFPPSFNFFSMFLGSGRGSFSGGSGKAWINRTLERNPVPAIWISNTTDCMDPAYLRRFDYSMEFPVPPLEIRREMARHHFDAFDPSVEWLDRMARSEEVTPAQFERAARVARLGARGNKVRALELAEQALERSMALLDQQRTPKRNVVRTGYDLKFLNIDVDIERIIEGLRRRPCGTFCFYGAAGTGKSELARHIADRIGKPLLVKRASDLLDMYVGQSEKNIAAMFEEARRQDAVLVLDEADSYLSDRRNAHRSWEVTQVNELLTQMESFEGVFICTTNLMDNLDQASLRRFAFKVRFDPLTAEQRWEMFEAEFRRLGGLGSVAAVEAPVRRLDGLTPGDFAVAARQFELWASQPEAAELVELLRKECEAKKMISNCRIGF